MSDYSELLARLDELGSGATFWDALQPYYALHQATYEVAARLDGWAYGTATLTVTAGQDIVALPTTALMTFKSIEGSDGKLLYPTELSDLADYSLQWRNQATGRPAWIVMWDWNHVRVWPRPDATYTYTLRGAAWPSEVLNTSQTTEPFWVRKAIVAFAASRLLLYTNPQVAQTERQVGEQYLARAQRELRKQGQWNTTRLRPGTGWSLGASGGAISQGRRVR